MVSFSAFSLLIPIRFSLISLLIVSYCSWWFSLTRFKPSRLDCPALTLVFNSVSLDFNSPMRIWTFRTWLPPSSTISPLSFRHSPSISWRFILRPPRSSLSFSTRTWSLSAWDWVPSILEFKREISWLIWTASNFLVSFWMKLYLSNSFRSLSKSSSRFWTSSTLPIAVRIEMSAERSFSSASPFSASYWAIPTRSSIIFLRSIGLTSVNRVIVPWGIMFWLALLIAAIDRISRMCWREILLPFSL